MIQITPKYTAVEETYAALRKHISSIWPENVKEEYVHKEGPMRIMLPKRCDHFLVSLPYPFTPELETILINDIYISFWWLLPITKKEADYAEKHGAEALEEIFEKKRIVLVDVRRKSAVPTFWG